MYKNTRLDQVPEADRCAAVAHYFEDADRDDEYEVTKQTITSATPKDQKTPKKVLVNISNSDINRLLTVFT